MISHWCLFVAVHSIIVLQFISQKYLESVKFLISFSEAPNNVKFTYQIIVLSVLSLVILIVLSNIYTETCGREIMFVLSSYIFIQYLVYAIFICMCIFTCFSFLNQ